MTTSGPPPKILSKPGPISKTDRQALDKTLQDLAGKSRAKPAKKTLTLKGRKTK